MIVLHLYTRIQAELHSPHDISAKFINKMYILMSHYRHEKICNPQDAASNKYV